MVASTTSGFLVSLVDYYIFCLWWGSKDRKTVPEFYEKHLWITFLFQAEERKLLVTDRMTNRYVEFVKELPPKIILRLYAVTVIVKCK